jgi:hypothetical protein
MDGCCWPGSVLVLLLLVLMLRGHRRIASPSRDQLSALASGLKSTV